MYVAFFIQRNSHPHLTDFLNYFELKWHYKSKAAESFSDAPILMGYFFLWLFVTGFNISSQACYRKNEFIVCIVFERKSWKRTRTIPVMA